MLDCVCFVKIISQLEILLSYRVMAIKMMLINTTFYPLSFYVKIFPGDAVLAKSYLICGIYIYIYLLNKKMVSIFPFY